MNIAFPRRIAAVFLAALLAFTLAVPAAHAGPPATTGKPMELPVATGNPYGLAVGDTVELSNFRRSDFPICFFKVSCLFTPTVKTTVTEIQDTKNGTRFRLNGFGGYKGHPVYKDGKLIGVTHGSVGGRGYGFLFPTEQAAQDAQSDYQPLTSGFSVIRWLVDLINWFVGGQAKQSWQTLTHDFGLEGSSLSSAANDLSSTSSEGSSAAASLFDPAGVDPKEGEFEASNQAGWTRNGTRLLGRIQWNPTTRTFHVDPAEGAGHASLLDGVGALAGSSRGTGSFDVNAAWEEAVDAGVPDVKSLRQQFICHAQGSAIRRSDWKLELGKPATTTQADQARHACNPPAPVSK